MSRDITSGMSEAVSAATLYPIILAQVTCVSGDVLLWSGIGDLVWNGRTFKGSGTLGGISEIEETPEISAKGITLSLSGVPVDLVEQGLSEMKQGLPARVWLGCLTASGALIEEPFILFDGFTDIPTVEDGADTCTLSITAESELVDLERARTRRYTPEDQHIDYPGDKGFDFVASLQSKEFKFGRA